MSLSHPHPGPLIPQYLCYYSVIIVTNILEIFLDIRSASTHGKIILESKTNMRK